MKAEDDGVLDQGEALRLDRLAERDDTLSDARFVDLVERVSQLELRVDYLDAKVASVDAKVAAVEQYAQKIDASLRKFKAQYRKHLKRRAAASTVSAVVGVLTLGMGAGLVGAVSDTFSSVFNRIVDFSDTQHVITAVYGAEQEPEGSDLAEAFAKDKLDSWVHAPLEAAVKDQHFRPEHATVAALLKTCVLLNGAPSPDAAPAPPSADGDDDATVAATESSPDTEPARSEATGSSPDAEAAFGAIKQRLGVPAEEPTVPLDDDFVMAFEICFDVDFDDLGDEARVAFQARLARGKPNVTSLTWTRFYKFWKKTGKSMEDYVASLPVPAPAV
mmetsp:Transcript_5668/g.23537  ORF Transcript_5668/g.23537 Transcript_5668/m.23537 type:complete len:332 (-) Transcript_5668:1495-2490(-)